MAVLEDTEVCAQNEDCPLCEGTYNNFAQQMRDDKDEVILIRDAMTELSS